MKAFVEQEVTCKSKLIYVRLLIENGPLMLE